MYKSADGEELADNLETKLDKNTSEGKDKRDQNDEEAIDKSENGADERAEAVAEGNIDDDGKKHLDVSDDGEDKAESAAESLQNTIQKIY